MEEIKEILLVTENSPIQHQCTVSVWDPTTKNSLQVHKEGGIASPRTLSRVGNDYIVTGDNGKPLLHFWPSNSQDQVRNLRFVLPGIAKALAVCPHNVYLAIGIGPKIYIWHLSSGRLLAVEQKHFQDITCVKFSSDGCFVIVGGSDGCLVVWKLSALVSIQNSNIQSEMGQVEPFFSKMDHTSGITDLHVGLFGTDSLIATASNDRTVCIYKLSTGELLLHVIHKEDLLAVTMDNIGWKLYLGAKSGDVLRIKLAESPRSVEYHVKEVDSEIGYLKEHEKSVTCLSLGQNGDVLASGGHDSKVVVWNTISMQSLFRLTFKGQITNLEMRLSNAQMFAHEFKPSVCLDSLKRNLNDDSSNFVVNLYQKENVRLEDDCDVDDFRVVNKGSGGKCDEMLQEICKLKSANNELYQMSYGLIKKFYNVE